MRAVIEKFRGMGADPRVCFLPEGSKLPASPVRTVAPKPTTTTTFKVLAEVLRQGFKETIAGETEAKLQMPAIEEYLVRADLVSISRRRTLSPLLSMPDVTNTLPQAKPNPPAISDQDFEDVARRNRIEAAAIKAVSQVESGGRSGFDGFGRPKILFEAHHFGPLTKNKFDVTHPHLSCPAAGLVHARRFYGWDQYERLHEALLLAPEAACEAASWGKFQVLGSNHNGWPDVFSFVTAMFQSEANHLKAFEAFCQDGKLFDALRSKNWRKFALGYNGKSQVGYDALMAAAYKKFLPPVQPRHPVLAARSPGEHRRNH